MTRAALEGSDLGVKEIVARRICSYWDSCVMYNREMTHIEIP